jgi:uncharacterized protein YozE (UPF0346 family)
MDKIKDPKDKEDLDEFIDFIFEEEDFIREEEEEDLEFLIDYINGNIKE